MSLPIGTLIQLKYSTANSTPVSLQLSEPAYSFVSDKLFIGDSVNNPIAIGGKFYTNLLDANTPYTSPNTLVTRDDQGSSDFNNLMANTLSANSTVYAGLADASPLAGATNPLIGAGGNDNNYVQNYIRNINAGGSASADFVAYPDNGSDVSGWVDMGITSSTYNDANFAITNANEGYLFMSAPSSSSTSGNLVIATDSTGVYNSILFQTGGFTDVHTLAHFQHNQGLTIDIPTESFSNSTGSLILAGGAGIQGAVYADALYDNGSRVLSAVNVNAGAGVSVTSSTSGNTESITITNTGVQSLTANTSDVTANATTGNIVFGLATTSVTAGTYGGATQVPSFTVDSKGRITFAGNNAISTSFNLYGDSGVTAVGGGSSLTIQGNTGGGILTSATSGSNLDIFVDDTVVRSNTISLYQTIDGDITISGNLNVLGTQTIVHTTTSSVEDSLLDLAANNTTSDLVDIGFVGRYSPNGEDVLYSGLIRHAGNKQYYIFDGYTQDPTANVVTPGTNGFYLATVNADINANTVQSGGFLAAEGAPSGFGTAGYSFTTDGGWDTGMFSSGDGIIDFYNNNVKTTTIDNTGAVRLVNGAKLQNFNSNTVVLNPDGTVGYGLEVTKGSPDTSQITLANAGGYSDLIVGVNDGSHNYFRVGGSGSGGTAFNFNSTGGDLIIDLDGSLWNFTTSNNTIVLPHGASLRDTSTNSVVFGYLAGDTGQSSDGVAIGNQAGKTSQQQGSVAIGAYAGETSQGYKSVAIGLESGQTSQGAFSVAVGLHAGQTNQQNSSVAIGHVAGQTGQGTDSVAVGVGAGINYQGYNSVAVGNRAGAGYTTPQGNNAIAIGASAGYNHQVDNSIALNASGAPLNPDNAGFYVNPVRNVSTANVMFYNAATSEVSYGGFDVSEIITGTLGVGTGGTGASSFSTKGVIVSDNSSTTGALSALTGSAYQVLQLDASGVPTFGGLNGGTF